MKKFNFYLLGILTGLANGLFGSGGGMIAVPLLEKSELDCQKSHATSIAITLTFSIISSIIYLKSGELKISDAIKYVPAGLLGAITGAVFLKKIPNRLLKKLFGAILIFAGVRLLIR